MAKKEPRERDTEESSGGDWQARLAEAMESRGLSGGELARRAGFTSQYVNSLRAGDRGARLPLDTARKIAAALGVSVDWLVKGEGPRERLSDVYVVGAGGAVAAGGAGAVRPPAPSDLYPSRAEAIALLAKVVEPEVIEALRAVVPEGDGDPGREFWIAYAKELARDLRRIKADPDLTGEPPPKSAYVPTGRAEPPTMGRLRTDAKKR
ncbi:MAG: helix-turn-helix transcriptional regulator [Deltaproteobacteria bacterium]|nr:helix-turn-helix transcriptional regulator [Deltaproteobacteria bacterium]